MDTVIVFTQPMSGGVSVVHPAPQARQRVLVSEAVYEETPQGATIEAAPAVYRDQTDEEFLAFVAQRSVPAGVSFEVVQRTDVPSDRTFRNAWTAQGGRIGHDTEKARSIAKDILRAKRQPLLDALDVQMLRAIEEGRPTQAIADEKQRLRDITQEADRGATIAELKTVIALLDP